MLGGLACLVDPELAAQLHELFATHPPRTGQRAREVVIGEQHVGLIAQQPVDEPTSRRSPSNWAGCSKLICRFSMPSAMPVFSHTPSQIANRAHYISGQFLPFLRWDGYYVVSELIGVPDLSGRIRPTLLSMLPRRVLPVAVSELRRRARVVVTAWALLTVSLLGSLLVVLSLYLPRCWTAPGYPWSALVTKCFRAWPQDTLYRRSSPWCPWWPCSSPSRVWAPSSCGYQAWL